MRDLTVKEVAIILGPAVLGITAILMTLVLTGHVKEAMEFSACLATLLVMFGFIWFMP